MGSSFTTGTDGDWRTDSTLANLLKVCNPHLIGGSKGKDSAILPDEDGRGLNVAVSGAVSEDASGQAKELGRKIRYDTKPSKYLGCTTQVRGLKIVDSFNIFCPGKSLVGPTSGSLVGMTFVQTLVEALLIAGMPVLMLTRKDSTTLSSV